MTQGKLLLANKSANGSGEVLVAPIPPSYEEATAGTSAPCYNDCEMLTEFTWDDRNIRRIFIRKCCVLCHISDPVLLLCTKTLSLSYMTGMLSSFYNTKSVVLCLGITAAVCLLVTLFSFQSKIDLTSYQGVLFVFCMVMFVSGIVLAMVLPYHYVPWLDATYAVLGAILFTMFLAFDTQLIMGNKRYSISPEEYVFATLNIYLDIIYIFSFFLQIFGTKND
ncbi:hypothetical protein F7725_000709 [Dissostichus mawsoni]|uniref:Protein lifeguard 2 n=1 Tax=Dissostichus mawsoni TaxID=36200 RepID=A0A7J5ZF76_DISMA|nr:hypothetical protein F7725_000709 [Dissostichus mawsoni]